MRSEKEIRDKLVEMATELDQINKTKNDCLNSEEYKEYRTLYDLETQMIERINMLEWVLLEEG